MSAEGAAIPLVLGAAGEAVPVQLLGPGGVGEAEEPQHGGGEGPLRALVLQGLPCLREVEEPCATYPGCTLESLEH